MSPLTGLWKTLKKDFGFDTKRKSNESNNEQAELHETEAFCTAEGAPAKRDGNVSRNRYSQTASLIRATAKPYQEHMRLGHRNQ